MKTYKNLYNDIDEIIGNKESRFFGNGFSKVGNQISDIEINCDVLEKSIQLNERTIKVDNSILGYVYAKGKLSYPGDWSKKSENIELKPHLSTIDALNLSVQLNEMFLTYRYNLNLEERKQMWLRKYSITAGTAPYEDLDNFDIYTICKEETLGSICSNVSFFESNIGALKVYCEIEHPIKDKTSVKTNSYFSNVDAILGDTNRRYYGNGYRFSDYEVNNIEIDFKNERIKNIVRIKQTDLSNAGIEGSYESSVTMLDGIILCGQIAQALLYSVDKVDRTETGTLWMRNVTMTSLSPFRPCESFIADTRIIKGKILNMKNKIMRKADLWSSLNGITCNYSLAYELPMNY